jgi:ketosteroid isomerase-like protein
MKLLTILLVFLIGTNFLSAQSNASEETTKKEILQLSENWSSAIINRDSVALEKVMAPEFTLNVSLPRKVWMNNTLHHLKTEQLKMIKEPKVTVYNDVIICEAVWHFKASFDGKQMVDSDYLITDIWKKNNVNWQILMRISKENK